EHSRTGRRPGRDREGCTGFCTDCLHPAVTFAYWPFRGRSSEVVRVKGKRLSIKSLQRIEKAIGSDGVSKRYVTATYWPGSTRAVSPPLCNGFVELCIAIHSTDSAHVFQWLLAPSSSPQSLEYIYLMFCHGRGQGFES